VIAKRFGISPDWVAAQLADRSAVELDELSARILDVDTVEELLK
jgi:hypothetical protein